MMKNNIKALRQKRSLDIQTFADRLGVSFMRAKAVEEGEEIDLEFALCVSEVLKCRVEDIYFDAPDLDAHNLVGRRFGNLIVLELMHSIDLFGDVSQFWLCQCDCGNFVLKDTKFLKSGNALNCGLEDHANIKNLADDPAVSRRIYEAIKVLKRNPESSKKEIAEQVPTSWETLNKYWSQIVHGAGIYEYRSYNDRIKDNSINKLVEILQIFPKLTKTEAHEITGLSFKALQKRWDEACKVAGVPNKYNKRSKKRNSNKGTNNE